MNISENRKLDDSALDNVSGGLFGMSEDTRTLYCTKCKETFKVPSYKRSGKCPICHEEVTADREGSWSGGIMRA